MLDWIRKNIGWILVVAVVLGVNFIPDSNKEVAIEDQAYKAGQQKAIDYIMDNNINCEYYYVDSEAMEDAIFKACEDWGIVEDDAAEFRDAVVTYIDSEGELHPEDIVEHYRFDEMYPY